MTIVSNRDLHRPSKVMVPTVSTMIQEETEQECRPYFVDLSGLPASHLEHLRDSGLMDQNSLDIHLLVDQHIGYLKQTWDVQRNLRPSFVSLDASRPWMLYWTLHGCDLVGHTPSNDDCQLILNTLQACWTNATETSGGFGGGPAQMPHAATTYAAVLALCILAGYDDDESQKPPFAKQALQYLNDIREPLFRWMMSLREKLGNGSAVAIRMQHDGEMDVRASYCVVAVAKLLGIARPELTQGVCEYVASCQTYEGGFAGEPWSEAHGGYAFCAAAALFMLGELRSTNSSSSQQQRSVDLPALMQWLASRQMPYEGGFSGRSNKLVDGCYSFWQGGAVAVVSAALEQQRLQQPAAALDMTNDPWMTRSSAATTTSDTSLFLADEGMLQRYILLCAQDVAGGLRDKPSKRRDFYHSCYNLSGLSLAQHCSRISFGHPTQSRVAQTHPCYNIRMDRVRTILTHFQRQS